MVTVMLSDTDLTGYLLLTLKFVVNVITSIDSVINVSFMCVEQKLPFKSMDNDNFPHYLRQAIAICNRHRVEGRILLNVASLFVQKHVHGSYL